MLCNILSLHYATSTLLKSFTYIISCKLNYSHEYFQFKEEKLGMERLNCSVTQIGRVQTSDEHLIINHALV